MSKKKRRFKKKKLTENELKNMLENMNSDVMKGKKVGFEMLQHYKPKIIDIEEKQRRKEKKHKKDYKFDKDN